MTPKCEQCNAEITAARLEVLPLARYCVNCSDQHTEPVLARMLYSGKTGGELFFAHNKEDKRRLSNEYRRAR